MHGGPGAAMRDHEIIAATWSKASCLPPPIHPRPRPLARRPTCLATPCPRGSLRRQGEDADLDGGAVVDAAGWKLSSGEAVSPLVWAPNLADAYGAPLQATGLRFVNRTAWYRCKPSTSAAVAHDALPEK